jgi:predicted transcriptional regulator of viral defense system
LNLELHQLRRGGIQHAIECRSNNKSRQNMLNCLDFMQDHALNNLLAPTGGIITHAQAVQAGINPHALTQAIHDGHLERIQRGVYRSTQTDIQPFETMLEVQLRIPYAIISHSSALAFHQLTTFIPKTIEISVPRNKYPPRLEYPRTKAHYLPNNLYQHGQEHHNQNGHTLNVYSAERTLADLLHQHKRHNDTLFTEGMKHYLQRNKPNIPALLEAARIRRIEPTMRDLLQVIPNAHT